MEGQQPGILEPDDEAEACALLRYRLGSLACGLTACQCMRCTTGQHSDKSRVTYGIRRIRQKCDVAGEGETHAKRKVGCGERIVRRQTVTGVEVRTSTSSMQ